MGNPTLSDLLRETHVAPAMMDRLARAVFNMGVRFSTAFTAAFIGPLPANNTEAICFTTPPIIPTIDNAQILIFSYFTWTVGASNTTTNFLLRRGATLAGALVSSPNDGLSVTPGGVAAFSGIYGDTPGAVTGQQYTLSIIQNGATGAGTFRNGALLAIVL